MENLYKHINNLKKEFGLNVIVALNKFNSDSEEEIEFVRQELSSNNIEMSVVEGWAKGGDGAIDIAQKVVKLANLNNNFKYIYDDDDRVKEKIQKIAQKIYGAEGVEYSEEALKDIEKIELLGKSNLPICIAKTQYSLSDDAKNLECKNSFKITIRKLELKNGAGFIVALAGKILTMPGLPKIPAAENIGIDKQDEVFGIF